MMELCTCLTDKEMTCIVHPTERALKERIAEQQQTIDLLQERIEELSDPGWKDYIALTRKWLEHYPPDIFTGVSGDPGSVFIVAIRNAVAKLQEADDE